jgi:hypothetical protein
MQYRKKPIVIEAVKLGASPELLDAALVFCGQQVEVVHDKDTLSHAIIIRTLEGDMTARLGDWIIRGVKGELYPCKPDIFEATYEAV